MKRFLLRLFPHRSAQHQRRSPPLSTVLAHLLVVTEGMGTHRAAGQRALARHPAGVGTGEVRRTGRPG